MRRGVKSGILAGVLGSAMVLLGGAGFAADAPSTADVLNKLHESDQKEIAAGKMAEKHGQSSAVKDYGKMLVKDHGAADQKVAALAKQEKVELVSAAPSSMKHDMAEMMAGGDFDMKFAREMLEDHQKDIAAVTEARDKTKDEKLKKLLSELLPTLQKHEEVAQKILDSHQGGAK